MIEPLTRQEKLKQEMLDEWSDFVGPVPFPKCALCQTMVDNLGLDVSLDREEYLFKTKCHGDSMVYHVPFFYAALIANQLARRAAPIGGETKDLRWTLPDAFTDAATRIDGTLHFDFFESLSKKIKPKEAQPISESEAIAKKEFEDEWEFENKRGKVISVDAKNKPL